MNPLLIFSAIGATVGLIAYVFKEGKESGKSEAEIEAETQKSIASENEKAAISEIAVLSESSIDTIVKRVRESQQPTPAKPEPSESVVPESEEIPATDGGEPKPDDKPKSKKSGDKGND